MKQILILFFLLLAALSVDLQPLHLQDAVQDSICVTVSGEVNHPGEIRLPLYATVSDALEIADPKETADLSAVNPQTILEDRDVISVPPVKEEEAKRISINTGSLEELDSLPGIGPSTAQKIIDHRNANGLFQNIEELMDVSGIGPSKFEKLKDLIAL